MTVAGSLVWSRSRLRTQSIKSNQHTATKHSRSLISRRRCHTVSERVMKSERGMHHFSARPTCQPSVPHELNPRRSLHSSFAHFHNRHKKGKNRFCKLFCAFLKEILSTHTRQAKPRHMPGPALMSPSPQTSLPAHPLAPTHTHTFPITPADSRACLCVEPLHSRRHATTQNSTKIHSLCPAGSINALELQVNQALHSHHSHTHANARAHTCTHERTGARREQGCS